MFQSGLHAAPSVAGLAGAGSRQFAASARFPIGAVRSAGRDFDLGGFDLAVDLGRDIGSRGWWLGLGACSSLCGAALALATLVPVLPSPERQRLTPAQGEMLRAQAIAPLALGGATGAPALPSRRVIALKESPERPRIEVTAQLARGDSFEAALARAGVGRSDIAAVVSLARPFADIGRLPRFGAGAPVLDLVLGRRESKAVPRPLEALRFRAAFDLNLAVERGTAGLAVKRVPIAVDSTPLRLQGTVGRSLERALRGAGVPRAVVADYVRTMGYAVDFQHGVGRSDRFDIVVERDRAETGDVRFGQLLYAGLDRTAKEPIALARFDFGGKPQFFRANGESARKGLMRTPLDGARQTSGFGMRFHPLLNYSRMHQGVDFGAAMGSPIYAAANGVVGFAARHGGHGNYVLVNHTGELKTAYAHLSRFAVRPGQKVAQGQVIGYVGSTGISTGPHLHYEVWLRGRAVNPVALKFVGGVQLAGDDLARFVAAMARMRGLAPEASAVGAATGG